MSQLQPIDPAAGGNHSQVSTSTGFVSLQYAYNLLQRGLERHQTTGELFSDEELATLGYFQEKMVLSEAENLLISKSREAVDRHQNQQKWLVASALLFTLALLMAPGWKWLLSDPGPDSLPASSQAALFNKAPLSEPTAVLPANAKVNVGPGNVLAEAPKEPVAAKPAPEKKAEPSSIIAPPKISFRQFDQEIPAGKVVIVRKGNKWGVIDRRKSLQVIPLQYDAIRPFSQDGELLQIKKGDQRGIVTAEGDILLHPYFDKFPAYYAEDGLIVVVNKGKYGVYSREASDFILNFEYEQICCYSEGLFGVKTGKNAWSFVDRSGQRAIDATFDAIEKPFSENRALVREGDNQFYIDKSGRKLTSWP